MLVKIIAIFASIIMLFFSGSTKRVESSILSESAPLAVSHRAFDKIDGVNGSVFYIERPVQQDNIVNAADFGLSEESEDNSTALQAAVDYCKSNPRTSLCINNGVYYFAGQTPIILDNCRDLRIEGNGASLVFSDVGYKFYISSSDCVEISNLNIDWAWESRPLASVVEITAVNPNSNTVDLTFRNSEYCSEDNALAALTQCDKDSFSFGARGSGKELYFTDNSNAISSVEKIGDNTLRLTHNGCMNRLALGEAYILRHFVYDGAVFNLTNCSKNITFDNVNIYAAAGMGYICEGNCSHFQIINSTIGVKEEHKSARCISTTADAIHIANTNGCFNISGCDFSSMGDDAINVHDGLGLVSEVNGEQISLIASAMRLKEDDILAFRDDKFEKTDIRAKVLSVVEAEGITKKITVSFLTGDSVKKGFTAYNTACDSSNYVIKNNYFHEHRARGLLLQSSNGLVEGNRFYKTMGQAIKVVSDIQPTLWQEGTGADNIVIRNNEFDSCSYSNWGNVIEISTNIDGRTAQTYVFSNIALQNNRFVNIPSRLMSADNVNGLSIENNIIETGSLFNKNKNQSKIYIGKACANIIYKNNSFSSPTDAIVKADSLLAWARANSQLR